ncbi:phosphatidate cytidylyltransferase [Desulfatirhabdium butyrativorans]|uniref:phosphatidate cytidylyltransferase n=1 Tax=Desulfatirhabdium butyrativorans TaxID=340467 RepID=UPI000416B018|nr:phosphatidate cytidylyltransferase [Desulfatirhabdium butyrativorans]
MWTRWITGLIALPILIYIISWGKGWILSGVVAIVAILALFEYFRMVFSQTQPVTRILFSGWGYVVSAWIVLSAAQGNPMGSWAGLFLEMLGIGVITLNRFSQDSAVLDAIAKHVCGIVYIPLALSAIVWIHCTPAGVSWVYFLLAVVFAGDIGALYVGTYRGKHKLCPGISPKKTIEGSVGGFAANLLVGLPIALLFLPKLSILQACIVILSLGAASQIGDLFESVIKRTYGIKDSGNILPGHGGMLDRIDALLFAAPLAWVFQTIWG